MKATRSAPVISDMSLEGKRLVTRFNSRDAATLLLLIALLTLPAGRLLAQTLSAQLSIWGGSAESEQASWTSGGLGRFQATDSTVQGSLDLGIEYQTNGDWRLLAQSVVRAEPEASDGRQIGVVQAFADWQANQSLRLRFGQFFLPTSQENIQKLWQSPYTLTYSAWNSWMGEELRPIGIDLLWEAGSHWSLGATVFGGNDAAGALLAWRGWSMGRRLSVFGETLPLPELAGLSPAGLFRDQSPRGARLIGDDLDGEFGYALRIRRQGARSLLQLTQYDNRGDRRLHDGDYAWDTHFAHFGGEWQIGERWIVAAEYAAGSTGMGPSSTQSVDIDFRAGYLLASLDWHPWRTTLRFDAFDSDDVDLTAADPNDDHGRAWTLALLHEPSARWRWGAEALYASGERLRLLESGPVISRRGWQVQFELRYFFGD